MTVLRLYQNQPQVLYSVILDKDFFNLRGFVADFLIMRIGTLIQLLSFLEPRGFSYLLLPVCIK